jgi:ATP synthase protein I
MAALPRFPPMNEGTEPAPPEDFDARLKRARERQRERDAGAAGRSGRIAQSGLGLALRIGVELVAALAVGIGIGLLLDRWLGTTPWLMVLFFLLGGAAGIFNVIRVATGMGGTVGYRRAGKGTAKDNGKDRGPDGRGT